MKIAIFAPLALVAFAGVASAQVAYTTGTYFQDFDSLAATGTTAPWANNSTLVGWLSFFGSSTSNTIREATTSPTVTLRVDNGGSTTGGLISYGSSGSAERALGQLGSGSQETVTVLVIQNNNNYALTDFTLDYTGEQWRNGGPSPLAVHSLVFDYIVQGAMPTAADASAINQTGYTAVPALNFNGPIATGAAAALDGNLAANRTTPITQTITVNIPAGSFLVMRWWDNNDPSFDHGLALDDVHFSATPTPGAAALLGLGMLASGRRRRA